MKVGFAGCINLWPRTMPARVSGEEMLDGRAWEMAELRANLRDIRRVNRLGGGTAAVLRELPALLAGLPGGHQVEILDLATGSADIPAAVVRWAKREGRDVRVVASDVSDDVLNVAADRLRDEPNVVLANYDARAVPLPDRSVDVVLCSLALHHFDPVDAVAVLSEMVRLAGSGIVVNDLVRCRSGYVAALAVSRLLTRNRLTRHDAPISVMRAYTVAELCDLAARAGIAGMAVRRRPLFRMVAVWKRPE